MMNALKRIHACGVVPVVVLDRAEDAVPTARALLEGGVNVMEITFRTAAAEESIRRVAERCPEMLVGAGTVISPEQCARAIDAGAKFIVSPGFDEEVAEMCIQRAIPITPGCVTPTEIMRAPLWHSGDQVLPRRRLRRRESDEGARRAVWKRKIHPNRRRRRGQSRRIRR